MKLKKKTWILMITAFVMIGWVGFQKIEGIIKTYELAQTRHNQVREELSIADQRKELELEMELLRSMKRRKAASELEASESRTIESMVVAHEEAVRLSGGRNVQ